MVIVQQVMTAALFVVAGICLYMCLKQDRRTRKSPQ
ncbi:Uncharacterised protein [Paenibacillus thiaminolyticus]|nr:Uncharacterised protein [Paenibacillus thiaminolyticus]